ncbi:MAG: nucleotidyltransferase family protein [Terracidiphilus sp.]|nr:nucleotidyltransferase family protein [Terracidiphilus sp.]
MKGIILAAGNGTRLQPLTNNIPKCLVPIKGVPLLSIWLDWCAMYGINQILINSHAYSERIKKFVATYKGSVQVKVTYEPELLGSAGTLQANRNFIKGEQEFAVLYADVLTNCRFDTMLDFHRTHKASVTIGTYKVSNPNQCGIIESDEDGVVIEFVEKPQFPKADTAFSGLMICGTSMLDLLPDKFPSDIGFDVLPNLIGQMHAFPIKEYLLDVGTIEKYVQANLDWPGLQPYN